MKNKSTIKKHTKSLRRKKISASRLILIILAIIIALAFVIFSVYTPLKKPARIKNQPSGSNTGISFKKEGSLSIFNARNANTITLDIEVADNEQDRMRGLMDRFSLPDQAGMLFIFENDEPRSFWMKNTYISLDIIFINSNKEIVGIQKYTQPRTTTSIPSDKPAMYVLEVNAGYCDKYDIEPGDKVEFSY